MVLVDSSVWINHFSSSSKELVSHLMAGDVVIHEFILGELSLAHFSKKDGKKIMERLNSLEVIKTSNHKEVYDFSLREKLAGKGIGWIDCHLLHACVTQKVQLFTYDKNLSLLAKKLAKT